MMLETARNSGFTAVFGECGCGKSVMRKTVAGKLESEGIKIVYPVIVDKERITPASLIDAIIMDISDENPRRSLEAKTRQAHRMLKNRAASSMKQVLIIEEAHLLSIKAIKCLKQIHELEDGFSKLIGIILIGQPELKFLLDESRHPELREVIRRCTIAEITDLGLDAGHYLKHKFDRVAVGRFEEIFAADCIDAILQRMPGKAYPLSVNNLVARSLNLAADMGETKVSAQIILDA
jgi:type II secretory pathway predicted ATPase ExeA